MSDGVKVKRAVVLFCPDIAETSTIKRVEGFLDEGCSVTVFGFRRERYNHGFVPPWPCVVLGSTADRRYAQRLWAMLRALPVIIRERRALSGASAFYARNIDQLLVVLLMRRLLGSTAPVAYEVLDIPASMVARGLAARLLRAVERFGLRRIETLVLSSPGFYRNYFKARQGYDGDWFLMENKLHHSILAVAPPQGMRRNEGAGSRSQGYNGHDPGRRGAAGRPWVIGCFGLIRGDATLDLIVQLAERLGGRVEFRFRGAFTTIDQARFNEALRRCPNITYGGAYLNPRDLEAIYGEVDFAWAIDLEHVDHNSRWLLPCRFYESGYFGVPCLAVRGFEVGMLIERLNVGWTFDAPLAESIAAFLETLTPEAYESRRAHLQSQPLALFVDGEGTARLLRRLEGRFARRREASATAGRPGRSTSLL